MFGLLPFSVEEKNMRRWRQFFFLFPFGSCFLSSLLHSSFHPAIHEGEEYPGGKKKFLKGSLPRRNSEAYMVEYILRQTALLIRFICLQYMNKQNTLSLKENKSTCQHWHSIQDDRAKFFFSFICQSIAGWGFWEVKVSERKSYDGFLFSRQRKMLLCQ